MILHFRFFRGPYVNKTTRKRLLDTTIYYLALQVIAGY